MKGKLFAVLFCISLAYIGRGAAQSGRVIVQKLWENSDKCREPLGSHWVPLPDGLKCGALWCNYPKDWCAIGAKNGVPDLFCAALDGDCQAALKEDKKAAVVKLATKAEKVEDDEPTETTPLPTTRKPKTTTTAAESDDSEGEESRPAKIKFPCEDFHDVCCFWAAGGECDRNPSWMKRTCRKSCGVCDCSPSEVDFCQSRVSIDRNCRWLFPSEGPRAGPPGTPEKTRLLLPLPAFAPATRPEGVPSVPGRQQPAPGGRADCQDRQPSCRFWASTGQCSRNPRFMSVNCRASCGLC